MDTVWGVVLLPILGSSFLLAWLGIVQRAGVKGKKSPTLYLATSYGIATIGGIALYAALWGVHPPQHLLPGFWVAVLAAASISIPLLYLGVKASTYSQGEVSLVSPLSAMTPGLVALLAITLGEFPGPLGIAGIACMVCGSWILMFKERPAHWWGYFVPFGRLLLLARYSALGKEDKERALVVSCALGSAFLSTFGLLCSGLYVRRAGDMQGVWTAIVAVWAAVCVTHTLLYLFTQSAETRHEWQGQRLKLFTAASAYAFFLAAGSWLEVPVFGETYVAYVGTLNRSRILFAVLLGYVLFREHDIQKRLIATACVVAGVLLIAAEGLPQKLAAHINWIGL